MLASKYFPQDEVYEAGMREAIEFIARHASSGSVVAQDAPSVVAYYSQRFQRGDLIAAELSGRHFDLARVPPADPVYVIVQKGLRYFENQVWLDYLEQHYKPIKEIWVYGVCTTKVYEVEGMP